MADTLNDRIALWVTGRVGTMGCAYLFTVIALVGFPQALGDAWTQGPLPLVSWLSQNFLQLVLLSIIMVGQAKQGAAVEARAETDHEAIMEMLDDMREEHAARHAELMAKED